MPKITPICGAVRSVSFLLLIAASAGCGQSDLQREFESDASGIPSGITRTDSDGTLVRDGDDNPVEVDNDDWRTAPIYAGSLSIDPAYPNPTEGQTINIDFRVLQFNAIAGGLTLRGYTDTGILTLLDRVENVTQPGAYAFNFSPIQLSASGTLSAIIGVHRVFIFDDRGEIVSYGDILVDAPEPS